MTPLLLVAMGTIAGTYGTIIGAGGGFIMVPILLLLYPDKPAASLAAASLFAVMCNGVSATAAYGRMRRVDYRVAAVFIAATVPGSFAGAYVVSYLSRDTFEAIFGSILTFLALYLFLSRRDYSKRAGRTGPGARTLVDSQGKSYTYSVNYWLGGIIAFGTGFLSSMLGIGGGLIMVPTMVLLLQIPFPVTVGTSQTMLMGTSLAGTLAHLNKGNLAGEWTVAPFLALGTVLGAQFGARISRRISNQLIARLLSLALAGVGIRLLLEAF